MTTIPQFNPLRLNLLATPAFNFGDPEGQSITTAADSFATVVPAGSTGIPCRLSVYERKKRRRKLDESEFRTDGRKYSSATRCKDILEAQLEEKVRPGFRVSDQEAQSVWKGDALRILSIRAIEKSDATSVSSMMAHPA